MSKQSSLYPIFILIFCLSINILSVHAQHFLSTFLTRPNYHKWWRGGSTPSPPSPPSILTPSPTPKCAIYVESNSKAYNVTSVYGGCKCGSNHEPYVRFVVDAFLPCFKSCVKRIAGQDCVLRKRHRMTSLFKSCCDECKGQTRRIPVEDASNPSATHKFNGCAAPLQTQTPKMTPKTPTETPPKTPTETPTETPPKMTPKTPTETPRKTPPKPIQTPSKTYSPPTINPKDCVLSVGSNDKRYNLTYVSVNCRCRWHKSSIKYFGDSDVVDCLEACIDKDADGKCAPGDYKTSSSRFKSCCINNCQGEIRRLPYHSLKNPSKTKFDKGCALRLGPPTGKCQKELFFDSIKYDKVFVATNCQCGPEGWASGLMVNRNREDIWKCLKKCVNKEKGNSCKYKDNLKRQKEMQKCCKQCSGVVKKDVTYSADVLPDSKFFEKGCV